MAVGNEREERGRQFLEGVQAVSLAFLAAPPYQEWNERLRESLRPKRYRHVLGVVQAALFLADRYGADPKKAAQAALLHDNAKHHEREYFDLLLEKGRVREEDWQPGPLIHAWIGSMTAELLYGVDDPEVLSAIRWHTTGKENMSRLEKVVYLADMVEPSRDFEGVDLIRGAAMEGLDQAVLKAMDHTLIYLIQQERLVDPASLSARNGLLEEMGRA